MLLSLGFSSKTCGWLISLTCSTNLLKYSGILLSGVTGFITGSASNFQELLFLEISLTENWLIFITRTETLFKTMLPSWQLAGAVLVVDIIATVFAARGWFGANQDAASIVAVWLYSLGGKFAERFVLSLVTKIAEIYNKR